MAAAPTKTPKFTKMVLKKISDLKPADYNPRYIKDDDFARLKQNLDDFDIVEPVVINGNAKRKNVIIGGHQRVRAAQELGFKEIPCIVLDLPLEKEKELNVKLNKYTGHFDFDKLANEFDMEKLIEWGFEKDIFGEWEPGGAVDKVEETSEGLKVTVKVVVAQNDEDALRSELEEFVSQLSFEATIE